MDRPSDARPDQVAALTEIWRQALDEPGLDEDSDVFENGGTSLHVLNVAGQIYQQLGTSVSLRDVFTHSTPRSLATLLYGTSEASTASTDGAAS
ncbi:acyl carrier protein [Kribbella sp. NPDC051718]|uniref:acyl carrier protein n=1 Tax=Kribbella sp. NPDC051718 TaxID=3155168 RepID=UPI003422ECAF